VLRTIHQPMPSGKGKMTVGKSHKKSRCANALCVYCKVEATVACAVCAAPLCAMHTYYVGGGRRVCSTKEECLKKAASNAQARNDFVDVT